MVQIFFIYSENCNHCQQALSLIESAVLKCKKIPCEIKKFLYNSPVAISIAINNEIDDLPGFVIGNSVFKGNNYTEEDIILAIKNKAKK